MDVNVQKQCVKVFTTEGVINMQPLLVLTQDMTGVAQEDTLVQGISDIRGDIANIDIDTSTLAKEQTLTDGIGAIRGDIANIDIDTSTLAQRTDVKDGNDTAVGVAKEIRSEVGTGSDTAAETGTLFAVVKWVKDKVKSIFNLIGSPASGQPSTLFAAIAAGGGGGGDAQESTSQEILSRIGSAGSGQSATLFGAIGDVALSAQTLQSLADSWAAMVTNKNSVAGVTMVQDVNGIVDILNVIATLGYQYAVTEIDDNSSTVLPFKFLYNNRTLKKVSFRAVTGMQSTHEAFASAQGLEVVDLPSVDRVDTYRNFKNPTLKEVRLPSCSYIYTYEQFTSTLNLILLEIGGGMSSSFNIATWSPTNALSSSSSSLVEPGETFANNLEKLLYNIRTYIAAELPDRTGQSAPTITLSSEVKAAINADTATAAAFTNKNWTIA